MMQTHLKQLNLSGSS